MCFRGSVVGAALLISMMQVLSCGSWYVAELFYFFDISWIPMAECYASPTVHIPNFKECCIEESQQSSKSISCRHVQKTLQEFPVKEAVDDFYTMRHTLKRNSLRFKSVCCVNMLMQVVIHFEWLRSCLFHIKWMLFNRNIYIGFAFNKNCAFI